MSEAIREKLKGLREAGKQIEKELYKEALEVCKTHNLSKLKSSTRCLLASVVYQGIERSKIEVSKTKDRKYNKDSTIRNAMIDDRDHIKIAAMCVIENPSNPMQGLLDGIIESRKEQGEDYDEEDIWVEGVFAELAEIWGIGTMEDLQVCESDTQENVFRTHTESRINKLRDMWKPDTDTPDCPLIMVR